jgi:hypothetical protein
VCRCDGVNACWTRCWSLASHIKGWTTHLLDDIIEGSLDLGKVRLVDADGWMGVRREGRWRFWGRGRRGEDRGKGGGTAFASGHL